MSVWQNPGQIWPQWKIIPVLSLISLSPPQSNEDPELSNDNVTYHMW